MHNVYMTTEVSTTMYEYIDLEQGSIAMCEYVHGNWLLLYIHLYMLLFLSHRMVQHLCT